MKNEYHFSEDGKTVFIHLKSKTYGDRLATIDANDLPLMSTFTGTWCLMPQRLANGRINYYVAGGTPKRKLHRFLFGGRHRIIDHIDGDGLNNRRSNLRPSNEFLNRMNSAIAHSSSGLRGVHKTSEKKPWKAAAERKGKFIHLGYFNTAEEARAVVTSFWEKEVSDEMLRMAA